MLSTGSVSDGNEQLAAIKSSHHGRRFGLVVQVMTRSLQVVQGSWLGRFLRSEVAGGQSIGTLVGLCAIGLLTSCFRSGELDESLEIDPIHEQTFLVLQGNEVQERLLEAPDDIVGRYTLPDARMEHTSVLTPTRTGFLAVGARRFEPPPNIRPRPPAPNENFLAVRSWVDERWHQRDHDWRIQSGGFVAYHPLISYYTTTTRTYVFEEEGLQLELVSGLGGRVSIGLDGLLYRSGDRVGRIHDPVAREPGDAVPIRIFNPQWPILADADGYLVYFWANGGGERWTRYDPDGNIVRENFDIPGPSKPAQIGANGTMIWVDDEDTFAVYEAPLTLESYRVLLELDPETCPCPASYARVALRQSPR